MGSSVETRSGMEIEEVKSFAVEIDEEKLGASYKYGLITPFLQKFPFEDVEHLPSSYYYGSPDSDSDCDDDDISATWRKYRDPNAHATVKKFLRQVRESNGYEVDCCPPPMFWSPFEPGDPETKDEDYRRDMMRAVHFAIDKINIETSKNYKLVKVERTVTCNYLYLLTFTVKEGDADVDASLETLRAMVRIPYSPKVEIALLEWMYKPPSPASESVELDRKKAKIGESTSIFEGLCSAEKSVMAHLFSKLDNKSAINLSLSCKSCWYAWASHSKSLELVKISINTIFCKVNSSLVVVN